jgi:hypothetical protein
LLVLQQIVCGVTTKRQTQIPFGNDKSRADADSTDDDAKQVVL